MLMKRMGLFCSEIFYNWQKLAQLLTINYIWKINISKRSISKCFFLVRSQNSNTMLFANTRRSSQGGLICRSWVLLDWMLDMFLFCYRFVGPHSVLSFSLAKGHELFWGFVFLHLRGFSYYTDSLVFSVL